MQYLRVLKNVEFHGTVVTDGGEWPCGYWVLNLCPLEEEKVILTTETALILLFYAYSSEELNIFELCKCHHHSSLFF